MARTGSDRPLLQALAQLRAMSARDRAAILDLLEPASRLRVERLLQGEGKSELASERVPAPAFAAAGYSPWLLQHLEGEGETASAMTAPARDMLRGCADIGRSGAIPPASPRRRPLRRRLAALLPMKRRPA
jgi:hypothetical protein